jgi:putative endonuclease
MGNVYVGCTENLRKRLKEHQDGLVESTKNRRPLTLFHTERYSNLSIARRREKYLKSLYGYRERKRILKEWLEKNK